MFAGRYFARRYFAARYWPKVGAAGAMAFAFDLIVEAMPASV